MRRSRELFFGGMGVALCVAATLAQAEVLLARPHQPTEAELRRPDVSRIAQTESGMGKQGYSRV